MEKATIILLIVGLKKKTQYKQVDFFLNRHLLRNVKVESNFSNYVTKSDLENVAGVGTSKFANKADFANL